MLSVLESRVFREGCKDYRIKTFERQGLSVRFDYVKELRERNSVGYGVTTIGQLERLSVP